MRAGVLDEHDDGDGDSGEAGTVAQAQEPAEDYGEQDGEDVVPGQRAEEGESESERRANESTQDAIAGCSDGGAEVGLEDNDGADRAPVAIVHAEAECDAPAEGRCQCCFCGMNEKAFALPGEEATASRLVDAEFDREIVLRLRFETGEQHLKRFGRTRFSRNDAVRVGECVMQHLA